jgi:hypothetical protein
MLIALNRRVPRTKSVFDRTSSRRYSSVDCDSNGFYDNQQEHNEDIRQNHLNFIDSRLRQNDDDILSLNGHENLTMSFDGDNDSDEYACFILQNAIFFSPYAFTFLLYIVFIIEFYEFFIDEKHELKVQQLIDKVCDEVQCRLFQLTEKNKKCKKKKFICCLSE